MVPIEPHSNRWKYYEGKERQCHRILEWIRMYFKRLCCDAASQLWTKDSRRMCSTEILGMSLHILGQCVGNRSAQLLQCMVYMSLQQYHLKIKYRAKGRLASKGITASTPNKEQGVSPVDVFSVVRYDQSMDASSFAQHPLDFSRHFFSVAMMVCWRILLPHLPGVEQLSFIPRSKQNCCK